MATDARSRFLPPRFRRRCGTTLATTLALGSALIPATGLAQSAEPDSNLPRRPPGFVLIQETIDREGTLSIGLYGAVPDPTEAGLWKVKVWRERRDRVTVATDMVRCSTTGPMRVTGDASHVILRELNPGGPITPANRLDHLIWWAVCQPQQAGRDPATLGPLARQLGFPGTLMERQQVLPAPPGSGGGSRP